MNSQKNKIGWSDFTWNPISGCYHGCDYCYMRRMAKRFPGLMKYKFHPDKLGQPGRRKKPARIFVGSSGDMWGDWVDEGYITKLLKVVSNNERHSFQFLTKNPSRYLEWHLGDYRNAIFGTTVDGTARTEKNLNLLKRCDAPYKFVSFEPLLKPVYKLDLNGIDWVIIGGNSNKGADKPSIDWINTIIRIARDSGVEIFLKQNYANGVVDVGFLQQNNLRAIAKYY